MREIKIGEKTYGARATTLALLFYKQEFKADMISDFTKIDAKNYDTILILQMFWAMNKAYNLPEKQLGFELWLETLDGIDFGDVEMVKGILEEVAIGLFPKSASKIGGAKKSVKR